MNEKNTFTFRRILLWVWLIITQVIGGWYVGCAIAKLLLRLIEGS